MLKKIVLTTAVLVSVSCASDIFVLDVRDNDNGESFTAGFSNVQGSIDQLDVDAIKEKINYDDTDSLTVKFDFRGLPIQLSFNSNDNTLNFDIPDLNIHERFNGSDRDDSVNQLTDWLKSNGGTTVERIMKKLAEVSPVDPIAGNPNSLMATNVASDFDLGFTNAKTKISSVSKSNSRNANDVMIAASYSSTEVDGKTSNSYTLPISYSINFDRNRDEKIIFQIPLTYTEVEGAKSVSVGLKVGYQRPLTKHWSLTPSIGYSATGSADLGTLAQMASTSLTSSYDFELGNDFTLSVGNMIGYYSTVKLYNGEYAYDPKIQNTVYRNGLILNIPTDSFVSRTSVELFVVDTRYTGSKLYIDQYQEYGITYGFDKLSESFLGESLKSINRESFKIGLTYLNAEEVSGFKINFGYTF